MACFALLFEDSDRWKIIATEEESKNLARITRNVGIKHLKILEGNIKKIAFTHKGYPVGTTAVFVLFKAEMVLQDQKETKAKKDTEESKALGALQATQWRVPRGPQEVRCLFDGDVVYAHLAQAQN